MTGFPIRLAVATLLAAGPACLDAAPPARVEISYPSRLTVRLSSHGRVYLATLTPWPDAWRDISYIDLELHRPGRRQGRNLLSRPGNWHGIQPFYFVASDIADRPPGGAIFPNPRRILIQGTHEELEVTVVDSRVHPTGTEMHHAFDGLRLSLAIRRE
jgi:hypothetical protein